MSAQEALKYVGTPYSELDCALLVAKVQAEMFGRVTQLPSERGDMFLQSAVIREHVDAYGQRTDEPVDGDAVVMIAHGRLNHIGIYFRHLNEGYVLHSVTGTGVTFTRLHALRIINMSVEGFYKWPS